MSLKVLLNSLLVAPAVVGAALLAASPSFAATATEGADALSLDTVAVSDVESSAVEQSAPIAIAAAPEAAPVATEVAPAASPSVDQPAEAAAPAAIEAPVAPLELAGVPAEAPASTSVSSLEQVLNYSNDATANSLAQVTSVNQLSDVRPTDWAYEALSRLIENYGCIAGYPDGTFRGNRAMTRYEFAAGLNACLDALSERLGGGVSQEDLDALRRLVDEFRSELATLRGRVDNLEARVTELEENQFSTTTVLRGRTIFGFADVFGGEDVGADDNNFVFQSRVRLNFDTSFYGVDRLRARLQAGNFEAFNTPYGNAFGEPNQLAFSYGTDTDNDVRLSRLEYYFPVGPATVYLGAVGEGISDIVTTVSPLDDPEQGSISYFGYNPIYDIGSQGTGFGLTVDFTDDIQLGLGYLSGEGNVPFDVDSGSGLFDGDSTLFGQLTFTPGPLTLAFTYVNAYQEDPSGALVDDATVQNAYGLSANYALTDTVQLGGWISYVDSRVFEGAGFEGDGRSWSYAAYAAISDLGTPGSLLGLIVGVPPRTAIFDFASSGLADFGEDAALHVEAFYRFALTENISITPGIIWLSDPGNDNDSDDVFVGALRTSFSF